jgi:hypothetical protein
MANMIVAARGDVVISMDYGPTALDWVDLYDNRCVGWNVDDGLPVAHEAVPVIVGQLPTDRSSETAPVISPQWAESTQGGVIVPDMWRGSLYDFFTWLATNNGAARRLRAKFTLSEADMSAWANWAARNPSLVREP